MHGQTIDSILSATQVTDGFLVKETTSIKDTINYYTILHNQIARIYAVRLRFRCKDVALTDIQGEDVYAIPSDVIRRHNYLKFQKYLQGKHPAHRYHTSFSQHQMLNSKSGWTTVRETWAKMLLCVKGLGAEKVAAVVEQYSTPRALWDAFEQAEILEECARQKAALIETPTGRKTKKEPIPEARHLLKGLGTEFRPIGEAVSAKVYDIFRAADYYGEMS
jgi:crossover junction endonuclease MUS81